MPLAFLDKSRSVAPAGYSRWLIPPAALCVHLSIGQVYAFSVFKTPLQGRFDTSATAVAVIFSIAIVMLGLSAAVLGTWVERSGPRKAMFAAALCWGTGFLVGALGIAVGSIWLLYLGYGVIGGIGLGIGYISPVSTLIKWFPDRPGLATGMAIMGFGGGALIASPASTALLTLYGGDPSTTDAAPLASTFLTLGLVYLVFMLIGSALIRVAPGYEDDATAEHQPGRNGALVRASEAIRTRQFWALWVILFCNVTAGIGILEQAAPMIQDFFREGSESSVTPAAAAGFVGMLSLANMAGRFVWSTTSDKIGRKPTYMMYLGVGAVLYLLMATLGQTSVVLFVVLAMVILSYYGGGFATIPAYLKDMFGTLEVGAIHGRLLTAWAAAGVAGPLIVNGFLDAAGEPGSLVASDYYPALLTMVGLLVVGFLANLTVTPLSADHTDQDAARRAGVEPGPESGPESGTDHDQDRTASTSGGSR